MWNIKMTVNEYGGPEVLKAIQEPICTPEVDEVMRKGAECGRSACGYYAQGRIISDVAKSAVCSWI